MIKISDVYSDEDRTIEILGKKFHWPLPIAFMTHSSCAIVLGWHVYGDNCPKVIENLHTVIKKISDINYEFKYRFVKKHKYNVIYPDLEPGYYDEDTRILYACMACLCGYIDANGGEKALAKFTKELIDESLINQKAPEGMLLNQADKQVEALSIYRWWKYEKPFDEKQKNEMLMNLYGKPCKVPDEKYHEYKEKFRSLEKKIEDDEQSYLHRLIDIRQGLWT